MPRKNVTRFHGNEPTYQITGKSRNGIGGVGAWYNAEKGGQRVVYTDFSTGADRQGRAAVGAGTAIIWGARLGFYNPHKSREASEITVSKRM